MIIPRAAASPKHVHKTALHKRPDLLLHLLARLVVSSHAVWQTSVWVGKNVAVATLAQVLNVANHVTRTKGTVQPYSKRLGVLNTVPKGLVGLPAQRTPTVVHNGATHKNREADTLLRKVLLNCVKGSLGIQSVKDCLHQQHIHTTSQEGVNLHSVGSHNLVKGHVAESGVLHRRRNTQRPVCGPDRATNKTRLGWVLRSKLSAALFGNLSSLLVDQVHLLLCLQLVVRLGNGGTAERISLNKVSSALKELAVDLADDIRTGDHKNVVVALQGVGVVCISLPAEVRLIQLVLLDRCSHGTINHKNTLLKQLLNHAIVRSRLNSTAKRLVHRNGSKVLRREELNWDTVQELWASLLRSRFWLLALHHDLFSAGVEIVQTEHCRHRQRDRSHQEEGERGEGDARGGCR